MSATIKSLLEESGFDMEDAKGHTVGVWLACRRGTFQRASSTSKKAQLLVDAHLMSHSFALGQILGIQEANTGEGNLSSTLIPQRLRL